MRNCCQVRGGTYAWFKSTGTEWIACSVFRDWTLSCSGVHIASSPGRQLQSTYTRLDLYSERVNSSSIIESAQHYLGE